MFRRLLIDDWTVIFTIIAFATALSVYLSFFVKALRMRPALQDRFAALPFQDENETRVSSRHE